MRILFLLALIFIALSEYQRFDKHQVIRFNVTSDEQLEVLKTLEDSQKLDFWSENYEVKTFDVRVPAEHTQEFKRDFLQKFKISHIVLIDDLQKRIELEMSEMAKVAPYNPTDKNSEETFFDRFRTNEEHNAWMKEKVAKYPNLVESITVGKSYEKRDIFGIKIHNKSLKSKGSVLFHGGIHSREWISPSTVSWIANELITKYESDPVIKKLVDQLEWHIFPVLNVDGYHFTHTSNRMWRKTRKPNPGSSCVGTDPNRNWAYKWNSGGSSSNPCSETFHGSAPFSEPEVKQMAEYGKKLLPNLKGYIDFHAYGQLYMRPWGWTRNDSPDEPRLKKIGDESAVAISRVRGKTYRSGKIAVIIYVASGSSADWFYGEHKVNAFALELGTSFTMPTSEIRPVGRENMEGVKKFGQLILE